ncbi:hypothetical protein ACSIGC_17945 (plasmid) [Tenacibaculum sp. ZS6-P6]
MSISTAVIDENLKSFLQNRKRPTS